MSTDWKSSVSVRYIGSKARLVDAIFEIIGPPTVTEAAFVDIFAGTGAVAEAAASRGWPVRLNDHLLSSTLIAGANLIAEDEVSFAELGGYQATLDILNDLPGENGFIHRHYSPASADYEQAERRYFTEANARRMDAVRRQIRTWREQGQLTDLEHDLLVADVLAASNAVANIAGTYGCFLSRWSGQSQRTFELRSRPLRATSVEREIFCEDAVDVPVKSNDVAYLDPPYTKRQYAAYYHLPETIAYYDEPDLSGKTGLRPWKHLASDYCYKTRALDALVSLIDGLDSHRTYLSYSSEGHVDLGELTNRLSQRHDVNLHDLGEIGRYRPNQAAADSASDVSEYLVEITEPHEE